jgi:site-specific DNA-methyltransferase (adenine-specific)
MMTNHTIIEGDSRKMTKVNNNSVNLVITSPPYWQLKDYGTDNQIGFNQSYEDYINNLNLVWKECHRVLTNGGKLCVNIGDQFARAVYYGRYKVIPIRTEIIKFCESLGFDYMGAIIWQKKTTSNTTGGASLMGSYPYPNNGIISIDYEFILIFKKLGSSTKPNPVYKEQSKMTKEEWKTFFSGHWHFSGIKQDKHLAMFPPELPRRLIKMYSFVNDTVLDPFCGSGTTIKIARDLNRNSIGYEINPDFIPIIKEKISPTQKSLFDAQYHFIRQKPLKDNILNKEIEEHSYIFKDFHQFNKKIDPQLLHFGSKINHNTPIPREEFFSVKEILSPTLLRLENNLTVKLLGIKEKSQTVDDACYFLRNKTKGQKVFLKYDSIKYDEENYLLVYMYLKNKTFLNAHLIKQGFVLSDRNLNYKNKDKFIKLEENYEQKTS